MLGQGSSLLATVRRHIPFGNAGRHSRTRIGLQLRGDYLALARIDARVDIAPRLEQLQWLHVEQARRGETVRRLAHTNVLRDAHICLVLAPGEYDLYQLPAPNVPDEELRDALRWQLRGTLPYAPEDAEIDFARIPTPMQSEPDTPTKAAVLVVAAPRATVEQLVAPFVAAGLEVGAVDIPEFAQRNLALLSPQSPSTRSGVSVPGCVAWLGFDYDACVLSVQTGTGHAQAGELCFTRRIHIPGVHNPGHGALEAEHLVNHLIERIVTQVQRSLDVFERQSGQPPVTVLTVGPHRYDVAVAQTLADRLALMCHTFEADAHLKISRDVPATGSPIWADSLAALGAALRVERPLNVEHEGWAARASQRLRSLAQSWRRAA